MKNRTHTKIAFISLLFPILYVAIFLIFGFLATITEFPTGRSGIYILFASIDIFLMMVFPAVQIGCSIVSIMYQIKALRNNESKVKNIVMMIVAILYFAAAIMFSHRLWLGMMSV